MSRGTAIVGDMLERLISHCPEQVFRISEKEDKPLCSYLLGANGLLLSGQLAAVTVRNCTYGFKVSILARMNRRSLLVAGVIFGLAVPLMVSTPSSAEVAGSVADQEDATRSRIAALDGFASAEGRVVNTRDTDTPKQGKTADFGTPLMVDVAGLTSVPSSASAAALNITATSTEEWGFIGAYPCSSASLSEWPGNSNLNFDAGMTVANSAIVPLENGKMCLVAYGMTDVIVDVAGYMMDSGSDSSSGSDSGSDSSSDSVDVNALTFDLEGAVGVALATEAQTRTVPLRVSKTKLTTYETSSNLLAVDPSGLTRPAVLTGIAEIGRLMVAPDDKIYVLFEQRVNLENTSVVCENQTGWDDDNDRDSSTWDYWEFIYVINRDEWIDWDADTNQEIPRVDYWLNWEQEQVDMPNGWYYEADSTLEDLNLPPDVPQETLDQWENDLQGQQRYIECEAPPCLLGQIDPGSGAVSCIDNTLDSIWWNDWDATTNGAIQFDDAGGIYYHGSGNAGGGDYWSGVLRRYADGTVTDLVTDNVSIQDFLVTGSGDVYITGSTSSTNDSWFRVLTAVEGQERPRTSNIRRGYVNWMMEFPDGNVYFGDESSRVERYVAADDDTELWLSGTSEGYESIWVDESEAYDSDECGDSPAYLAGDGSKYFEDEDGDGFCGGYVRAEGYNQYTYPDDDGVSAYEVEGCYTEEREYQTIRDYPGYDSTTGDWADAVVTEVEYTPRRESFWEWDGSIFCHSPGQLRQPLHRTLSGEVFGVSGYEWGNSSSTTIAEYYPEPRIFSSIITRATTVLPVFDYMIMTGTTADEDYVTTLFDLGEEEETMLIDEENEIEIYRMNFLAGQNKLMFDGLRFFDSSYVIGSVDLSTGDVIASQTGGQQLLDFSLFSN